MNNKKIFHIVINVLAVIGIIMVLIFVPFLIEKIIMDVNHFPFNIDIKLSRESWFGFMASYMGAIGTVILGIIALWQNKRYKELSDKSSGEVKEVQSELKNLSEKTVEAIKTLERIEIAIYTPVIYKLPYNFYGITKKKLDEQMKDESVVYQINYINVNQNDLNISLDKLMSSYKTFGFVIKNAGEKTIRSLICTSIKIDGNEPSLRMNSDCDIISGGCANILFVNLPIKVGETEIELSFEFSNLIMEWYKFSVNITIMYDKNSFDTYYSNFEKPIIINKDKNIRDFIV